MRNNILLIVIVSVTLFVGCKKEICILKASKNILPEDKNGNFILHVSNQSFAVDPVDIKVYINDKLAVYEDFYLTGRRTPQHNWKEFQFNLSKGIHKLKVESVKGNAVLEKEFEIKGKHWAAITYPNFTTANPRLKKRYFSFTISDEPILFE